MNKRTKILRKSTEKVWLYGGYWPCEVCFCMGGMGVWMYEHMNVWTHGRK